MAEYYESEQPITKRFSHIKQTVRLTDELKRQIIDKPDRLDEPEPKPNNKRVAMFVLGMVERINLDELSTIVLGRFEPFNKEMHQLDLTDYGAVARGVSRVHCQLTFEDEQMIVTDLGSANGTYVAGKRIEPHQPRILKQGEDLVLGRLPIQIVYGR